jgi:hypothetical protein
MPAASLDDGRETISADGRGERRGPIDSRGPDQTENTSAEERGIMRALQMVEKRDA